MLRHSRAHTRAQRERYIAKRRRKFDFWLSGTDWGAGTHKTERGYYAGNAPRPMEVREGEFWTPERIGRFSKWNGTCQHCSRLRKASPNRKHPKEKYPLDPEAA